MPLQMQGLIGKPLLTSQTMVVSSNRRCLGKSVSHLHRVLRPWGLTLVHFTISGLHNIWGRYYDLQVDFGVSTQNGATRINAILWNKSAACRGYNSQHLEYDQELYRTKPFSGILSQVENDPREQEYSHFWEPVSHWGPFYRIQIA